MDSLQNQEGTQHTQQLVSSMEQQHVSETKQELKSKSSSSSSSSTTTTTTTQQCKNGGEETEGTHEESIEEEPISVNDRETREENGESEMGPRERLKRHRTEVAGQVWIPDMWGQEDFLKDWIDCSAFDACLVPQGIMSARSSLVEEARRASSGSLRVENSC